MDNCTFPILHTERLLLRHLSLTDRDDIFLLRSNDSVNQFIVRNRPTEIAHAVEFINKILLQTDQQQRYYWVITSNATGEFMGTICLWNFSASGDEAEMGYELMPRFQNQRYMNEAMQAVINYAFNTIKLKAMEAFTHKDNVASINLLKKNNFHLVPGKVDQDVPTNIILRLESLS